MCPWLNRPSQEQGWNSHAFAIYYRSVNTNFETIHKSHPEIFVTATEKVVAYIEKHPKKSLHADQKRPQDEDSGAPLVEEPLLGDGDFVDPDGDVEDVEGDDEEEESEEEEEEVAPPANKKRRKSKGSGKDQETPSTTPRSGSSSSSSGGSGSASGEASP
jgi:hypothetical protein